MKTTKVILLSLGLAAIFTSCGNSKNENPTGSWTSAAPIGVTEKISGSTTADKTLSIDFVAPVGNNEGDVTLTAEYMVSVPFVTDSVSNKNSYQVTATIKGKWSQVKHEDDEYLITFDRNSLSVSGIDAPVLGPVTDDFVNSLANFTKIEDVKVSDNGSHLTFETNHPDVTYHFIKK